MEPQTLVGEDPESKFDVTNLGRALARRWSWFLAALIGCLIVGASYLMMKSPVYEARTKIRIGQVAGDGAFEPAEVLASRLLSEYGPHRAYGDQRARPYLSRALVAKGNAQVVELSTEGDTAEDAANLLRQIAHEVGERHRSIFENNVAFLKERLAAIDEQRTVLRIQYAEASEIAGRIRKTNPIEAALIAVEVSALAQAIARIDADRPEWARDLVPPKTEPTETLGAIHLPLRPSAPKQGLVLMLASLSGIFLGAFLVMVVEFVVRVRQGFRT